jgi:ABC-type multidrug transport system fused ATPase/permease subunit
MACAILTTLMALVYPKLAQIVVDDIITPKRGEWLLPAIGGLVAAFFLRDAFNCLRIRLNNVFEQKVIYDLRRDLYEKLQRLSVSYYDKKATGDLMTRVIDDVNAVERVLIDGTEQGTVAVLMLVGVTGMMISLNPSLAALVWIPVPLLFVCALLFTTHAHKLYKRQRDAMSDLNSLLHDNLQGVRQIKSFNREGHELRRFEQRADLVARSTLDIMRLWSVYHPGVTFLAWCGTAIVLFFGGRAVMDGTMTLGKLVGFLGYATMFYAPIDRLHQLNQMLQAARAAGNRVFEIMDTAEEVAEKPDAIVFASRARGEVEFRHVHFHYAARQNVLTDINIHAQPGQTVALVGHTGAGKSTLVHLLPRFHDVTSGAILIDGVDVRDVTLGSLRAQIGIVTQEPFLFNGTVRENIMYGRLTASEAEMHAAARAANAHDFIMALPDQYDSVVGERGVKLSVGEKQRVCIARALLKDPPILILDEATASVDTHTEKLIQEALDRLMANRTCFMIAHRLSTVRNADQILVLDHGRIVERGTHRELLARDGVYAHLCRVQAQAMTIEETFEAARDL